MRVVLDYLTGPVLGHQRRCELLRQALEEAEHTIVPADSPHDWYVWDYPTAPPPYSGLGWRLLMGQVAQGEQDWGWHATHAAAPRTLTGAAYLIVDPDIRKLHYPVRRRGTLVSFGGADPYQLTEAWLGLASAKLEAPLTIVVGPNYQRVIPWPAGYTVAQTPTPQQMLAYMAQHRNVLCAWGNTAFEALACGCRVVAVAQSVAQAEEADCLGVPYVTKNTLAYATHYFQKTLIRIRVDTEGVQRIVRFMESKV